MGMSEAFQTDRGGGTDSPMTISEDQGYDLLSNHRRRYALHYLQNNGQQTTLGDLSEQIAAWENEIDLAEISADERKRVYTSLQQIHLPRMDEMGAVEYDDRAGVVELGPAAEELDVYMEVVRGRDVPWSLVYVGLGVVNLVLLVAAWLDVSPLPAIPDIGWAIFATTTFLVTAISHYCINKREMMLGTDGPPPEVDP